MIFAHTQELQVTKGMHFAVVGSIWAIILAQWSGPPTSTMSSASAASNTDHDADADEDLQAAVPAEEPMPSSNNIYLRKNPNPYL